MKLIAKMIGFKIILNTILQHFYIQLLAPTKKAHRFWCAFPQSERFILNFKPIYPRFGGVVLAERDNEFVGEMRGNKDSQFIDYKIILNTFRQIPN